MNLPHPYIGSATVLPNNWNLESSFARLWTFQRQKHNSHLLERSSEAVSVVLTEASVGLALATREELSGPHTGTQEQAGTQGFEKGGYYGTTHENHTHF